jgi:hypothetical protein
MCPSGVTCLSMDFFQWDSTIKIQLGVLVKYKADLIIISLKINLFSPWYSWKIAELVLNNNHSLDDCFLSLYFVLYRFVSNQIDVYEYIEKVNANF